ncbi:hypothetical protein EV361DRAFT_20939 [Lentinula raphanica]|nr:hypothetical protein EV361DRAFT_20939 [Lentinula raphanica]
MSATPLTVAESVRCPHKPLRLCVCRTLFKDRKYSWERSFSIYPLSRRISSLPHLVWHQDHSQEGASNRPSLSVVFPVTVAFSVAFPHHRCIFLPPLCFPVTVAFPHYSLPLHLPVYSLHLPATHCVHVTRCISPLLVVSPHHMWRSPVPRCVPPFLVAFPVPRGVPHSSLRSPFLVASPHPSLHLLATCSVTRYLFRYSLLVPLLVASPRYSLCSSLHLVVTRCVLPLFVASPRDSLRFPVTYAFPRHSLCYALRFAVSHCISPLAVAFPR